MKNETETLHIRHLSSHSWSVTRRFVLATFSMLAGIVWVHAIAALLRRFHPEAPLTAIPLTLSAALVAAIGVALLPRRFAEAIAGFVGLGLAATVATFTSASSIGEFWEIFVPALALPLLGVGLTALARRVGERMPASVDRAAARKGLAALWVLLSLLSIVQIGRLATHVADRQIPFKLATENPFWFGHECLPAYLYGAELALDGAPNLYHAHHYPALDAQATPTTQLDMAVEDPYQYPPQFLLLPAFALQLTGDMQTLRIVWFAAQISLFAWAFFALALWVGGATGRMALWLFPTTLMAWPMLFNFQFGQFHLAALAMAVLGMLAFAKGRSAAGGFLLAGSILAKVFPVVLLVPLIVKRRVHEVAWVVLWGAAASAATLFIFGPAPFVAFFDYHLPRLGSGAAFAFDEAWPEMAGLVMADNQGVFGLARKFGLEKPIAAWIARLFGLAVLAAAALWAWRDRSSSRWAHGTTWLALLGAASLASPGAWGDYVPTTALWLLALLAAKTVDRPVLGWALGVVATLQFFIVGTMPIGDWTPLGLMIPLSALGAISMLVLFVGTIAMGLRPTRARRPSQAEALDSTHNLRLSTESVRGG